MGKPKTTQGRGVSLPNEMAADVDKRIEKLKPWVNGLSSYVQRLIYLDLTYGLLQEDGGANETVINKAKGKPPFEGPLTPYVFLVK